jgi:hypothetical protein
MDARVELICGNTVSEVRSEDVDIWIEREQSGGLICSVPLLRSCAPFFSVYSTYRFYSLCTARK